MITSLCTIATYAIHKQFMLFLESDLKHRVRIQFINNVGLEEAGIDGGGIFKEFINEVLKTAFDPNRGFFLMTGDNTLYPNPNVHLIVENFTEHYKFIGRLVGKVCLYSTNCSCCYIVL